MNRVRVCLLLFAFTVVVAARAEETNTPSTASATSNAALTGVTGNVAPSTITIDGTTYEEVRWDRPTLSTVTIFHKTGVATIPLWKLPKELQERFGYDPQKVAEYQLRLKYNTDRRLMVDGRLVQAKEQSGNVVANPATIRDADGQTYKGTILVVSRVVGYTIMQTPSPAGVGQGASMAEEGSEEAYRNTVAAQNQGGVAMPTKFAQENIFVKDFFPASGVGTSVSFQGVPINPIGGYATWAVARKPSFEEWQKLQK